MNCWRGWKKEFPLAGIRLSTLLSSRHQTSAGVRMTRAAAVKRGGYYNERNDMTKKQFIAYCMQQGYEARYSGGKRKFFLHNVVAGAGVFVTPENSAFSFSFV